ncbi:MAG: hypothetical protein HC888_14285 [Candidatus Competibacteraceae bacterium]|nr:hypothetical protein [Candidatus Competibacteraceae bacterium]
MLERLLEQFLKLEDQLKEAVRRQNRAIQNSTTNAALALGLGRQGNDFVGKPAGIPHPVVVNGYVEYDVDMKFAAIKKEMSSEEFNFHALDSILRSLSTKSSVEIESFFQVANLKIQRVYERVMGVGSSEERETRRDLATIGEFGMWAGAAPGSTPSSRDLQQILGQMDPTDAMRAMGGPFASQFSGMFDGFGELGSASARPSNIQGGFYVQLQLAKMYQGMQQQDDISRASYVDPLTTTLNQFNPLHLINQSITNIEVGARVNGHDRGNLEKANIMAVADSAARGSGQHCCGCGDWDGFYRSRRTHRWTGRGAGALVNVLANSFRADPRTGAHSIQTTDQGLTSSFFQIGAASGGGLIAGGIGAVYSSGAQYDASGNYTGWSYNGDALLQSGLSFGISAGLGQAGCAGACGVGSGFIADTAMNTFIQEYKYTHGHNNHYLALTQAGPDAMGAFIAAGINAAVAEQNYKQQQRMEAAQKVQADLDLQMLAERAKHAGLTQLAGAIAAAAALSGRDKFEQARAAITNAQAAFLLDNGFTSFFDLEADFLSGRPDSIYNRQTVGMTDRFLMQLATLGFDTERMASYTIAGRMRLANSGHEIAIATAMHGAGSEQVRQLRALNIARDVMQAHGERVTSTLGSLAQIAQTAMANPWHFALNHTGYGIAALSVAGGAIAAATSRRSSR